MAEIFYVRVKYAEHRDTSRGYPVITQVPVGVEVCMTLTQEEVALIQVNRRRDQGLATLLGPAEKWEFQPRGGNLMEAYAKAYHSIDSNPHRVRKPSSIANLTLTSLQDLLGRLTLPG